MANHKGWEEKTKKMRTMERQMNMLISLKKKSPDRCMNIDYSEHQFTDRTTRCPKSENRSESTGIWTCWCECAQHIDLASLMRAESYWHKDISNLSGCFTSWWLLTICRNTFTLTNTNGEINLRFVITPLLITDKHTLRLTESSHPVYATLLPFIWHTEGGDGDNLLVCSSPRPPSLPAFASFLVLLL